MLDLNSEYPPCIYLPRSCDTKVLTIHPVVGNGEFFFSSWGRGGLVKILNSRSVTTCGAKRRKYDQISPDCTSPTMWLIQAPMPLYLTTARWWFLVESNDDAITLNYTSP